MIDLPPMTCNAEALGQALRPASGAGDRHDARPTGVGSTVSADPTIHRGSSGGSPPLRKNELARQRRRQKSSVHSRRVGDKMNLARDTAQGHRVTGAGRRWSPQRGHPKTGRPVVFLSGNGPLVKSTARSPCPRRDDTSPRQEQIEREKGPCGGGIRPIQNVHHFR